MKKKSIYISIIIAISMIIIGIVFLCIINSSNSFELPKKEEFCWYSEDFSEVINNGEEEEYRDGIWGVKDHVAYVKTYSYNNENDESEKHIIGVDSVQTMYLNTSTHESYFSIYILTTNNEVYYFDDAYIDGVESSENNFKKSKINKKIKKIELYHTDYANSCGETAMTMARTENDELYDIYYDYPSDFRKVKYIISGYVEEKDESRNAYVEKDGTVTIDKKVIPYKYKNSFSTDYDTDTIYFITQDDYLYSVVKNDIVYSSKIESIKRKYNEEKNENIYYIKFKNGASAKLEIPNYETPVLTINRK